MSSIGSRCGSKECILSPTGYTQNRLRVAIFRSFIGKVRLIVNTDCCVLSMPLPAIICLPLSVVRESDANMFSNNLLLYVIFSDALVSQLSFRNAQE
jgi:hypothetical protein